jgi:prepilin-type N-terminal cleavage/methylation domain-containing protein
MRHGFTLPELALVLALTGIVSALAVPALVAANDRAAVRYGVGRLLAAHREARLAAVLEGRVAILTVDSSTLTLRTVLGNDTTTRWVRGGPASWGLTYAAPARRFTFSPLGYSFGVSNATLILRRGEATGRLVVSRLGRTRVQWQ